MSSSSSLVANGANGYNFKKIQTVPTHTEFIDIVLSKTQRKTPTVIHKGYEITRIRSFYMRKVKFTQDSFDEKLDAILTDFPKIDDIHPFYSDLLNILYDRDHYKLALGQINTARMLIERVSKEYVRMLKFGDSLFRCKQLKIAALGKMATIMKRQKDSLAYLEQVRQHMSRLPSIDPNTRTLLMCGYPNVGKSSFMNKLTRANVDVQPYAFTTKSLFVGHMDYKYLRWQVIDTPGVLDHPLEDRNTIEMQSITALAHLRSCILYFVDISEKCGYSIQQQIALFHSIKPLFANKTILLVLNKIDLIRPDELSQEDKQSLQEILDLGVEMISCSCMTEEGVMAVKETACEKLLAQRVDSKISGQKINDVLNKLHLAIPRARDEVQRPAFIPEAVKLRKRYDPTDPERIKLERDLEQENGGAGVYSIDLKRDYQLANEEWKYDNIAEIINGKNIADFIDPDIEEKLKALELEEERAITNGEYDEEEQDEMQIEQDRVLKAKIAVVRKKRALAKITSNLKHNSTRKAPIPLAARVARNITGAATTVSSNVSNITSARKHGQDASRDRSRLGLKNAIEKDKSVSMKLKAQRSMQHSGRRGDADRAVLTSMPKHLFSGKRKAGTHSRR